MSVTLYQVQNYQVVLAEGKGKTSEKGEPGAVDSCSCSAPNSTIHFPLIQKIVKINHKRFYSGPDTTDTTVMKDRADQVLGEQELYHSCPLCDTLSLTPYSF